MHTLTKFSDGYYFGRAYLTRNHQDDKRKRATINSQTYIDLENELFSSKKLPIILKIKNIHIEVQPSTATPTGNIELAEPVIERLQNNLRLPSNEEFLVLTEDRVEQYMSQFLDSYTV